MARKKITKLLSPRIYNDLEYTTSLDIIEVHGKKWFGKWLEAYGIHNVGMMVPPFDPSHGRPEPVYGFFWWQYLKYKNLLDKNGPTDF